MKTLILTAAALLAASLSGAASTLPGADLSIPAALPGQPAVPREQEGALKKLPIRFEGAFNEEIKVDQAYHSNADVLVPVEILKKLDLSNDQIDEASGTVTVNHSGTIFEFQVDRPTLKINGVESSLALAPRRIEGVLYLPFARLAKQFGVEMQTGEELTLGVPTIVANPSLMWQGELYHNGMPLDYTVQIARDKEFKQVVLTDKVAITSQYVPAEPLPSGEYWWRVKPMIDKDLSRGWQTSKWFKIITPEKEFPIPLGAGAEEIHKVIQQASANTPAIVRFEKGEYRVSPSYRYLKFKTKYDPDVYAGGKYPPALLELLGVKNLVLDGGGSIFFIENESAILRAYVSKNIILRNFTFTTPYPLKPVGKVTAVDYKAKRFQIRLLDGQTTPEEKPDYFYQKVNEGFGISDASGSTKRNSITRLPFLVPLKKLSERVYEVGIDANGDPRGQSRKVMDRVVARFEKDVAPNDYIYFAPKPGGTQGAMGLFCGYCDDVTFYNVRKTDSGGYSFWIEHTGRLKFLKYLDKPRTPLDRSESGIILAGRAGAWMENSEHWCQNDDGPQNSTQEIHIHSQLSSSKLLITTDRWNLLRKQKLPDMNFEQAKHWQTEDLRLGDTVLLYSIGSFPGKLRYRIAGLEVVKNGVEVTLDKEIPSSVKMELAKTREEGRTYLVNTSSVQTGVAYRNCLFKNVARNAIYGTASNYLIENCRFESIGQVGLRVADYVVADYQNIVIRNNLIKNSALGRAASDALNVGVLKYKDRGCCLKNVFILNNRIVDRNKTAISVWSVENLLVAGNEFASEQYTNYGETEWQSSRNQILKAKNCRNIRFENNTISDVRPLPEPYTLEQVEGFATQNNSYRSGYRDKP